MKKKHPYPKSIAAKEAMSAAYKALDAALAEEFPVGCVVRWTHGSHERSGEVLEVVWGHRFQIRSLVSGKKFWLDAHNVLSR